MTDSTSFGNPTAAPLARALHDGDEALARELIAGGANPNAVDDDGLPLLQWAMLRDDRTTFRRLLALGADPARGNGDGQTALHLAAMGRETWWLDALLAHGMSPDQPNTVTGAPPLIDALRARLPRNVERLLEAGARLDAADRNGTTPLHQAAAINDLPMTLRLLEAGADPRATDANGATFQDYLFDGDPDLLHGEARRSLDGIGATLRRQGVPVTAAALQD
ncbi:ankyrin repeat domain-containing protein [Coralloluteibacterium thermophilus]|uniref:Ankyrin repeat domain-containing protein n=1 Tax=Coralloluteibacterium thermophilum TaxID=2707049 RepID=A0ABV9NMW6_9GAMM